MADFWSCPRLFKVLLISDTIQLKAWSAATAQPVKIGTNYRHTHKDLGLVTVNVYRFVFHVSSILKAQTHRQTNKQTDATKHMISPALWSIKTCTGWHTLQVSSNPISRKREKHSRYGVLLLWWALLSWDPFPDRLLGNQSLEYHISLAFTTHSM